MIASFSKIFGFLGLGKFESTKQTFCAAGSLILQGARKSQRGTITVTDTLDKLTPLIVAEYVRNVEMICRHTKKQNNRYEKMN